MDKNNDTKHGNNADGINLQGTLQSSKGPPKQPSSPAQRNLNRPPPPARPKPLIANKPSYAASEKRKSLTRQVSGPRPPLPSRPATLKKPPEQASNEERHTAPSRMESTEEPRIKLTMAHPSKEEKKQNNEVTELVRTMSGPIHGDATQQREKLRSVSLQGKENVAPKPVPRPKPSRRFSNEAHKPIPPPRTKKRGVKSKEIIKSDVDSQPGEDKSKAINTNSRTNKEELRSEGILALTTNDRAEVDNSDGRNGKFDMKASSEDPSSMDSESVVDSIAPAGNSEIIGRKGDNGDKSSHEFVVDSVSMALNGDSKIVVEREGDKNNNNTNADKNSNGVIMDSVSIPQVGDSEAIEEGERKNVEKKSHEVIMDSIIHSTVVLSSDKEKKSWSSSKGEEIRERTDVKSENKRPNPYENVPAFYAEGKQENVRTPETPKKPFKNPYENVPTVFCANDAAESGADFAGSKSIDGGIKCGDKEENSEEGNDYENLRENEIKRTDETKCLDDIGDSSDDNDYENSDVIDWNRSGLDSEKNIERQGIAPIDDFASSSFMGKSSPLNFQRLRIDAENIDADSTYETMPRKGSQLMHSTEGVGETRTHLSQVESLSQQSYYQCPASPQQIVRRNLFGNDDTGTDSTQAHRRIRRPPPQPPAVDDILRSRGKSNDSRRLEIARNRVSSSAKPLPTADDNSNIYVAPKVENDQSSSLGGDSGGETDSLASFQSAQSSLGNDITNHIYKEPVVSSRISVDLSAEYSIPRASSPTNEYVAPDSFGKSLDLPDSMPLNRQSYAGSDSSDSARSSGGVNLGSKADNGYESVGESLPVKPRCESTDSHSGSEYVDMSPMKEEEPKNTNREYLEPLTMENRTKRRPPARPAPPAPVRLAKRPDDLPLLPVPAICAVPIDMSKSDSLDEGYERIQSLRRAMGLTPTIEGDESDSEFESEEESTLKEGEDEEKKNENESKEGDSKPKSKLYHIAHEILTTERTFVNALRLVCDEFATAAKNMVEKDPSSLPKHSFSQMFDDIELIYDLDKRFLQELEDRMKDWDAHNRIGDIVRKYGHFLRMYTNYIRGYDKAMAIFQECCHKMPKFAALVKEYERLPSFQNLKITSYMLKPIQRIPSYRLLLVDYLKHLPIDSKDYEDVSNGLNVVSEVAKQINESMKEGDKFQVMLKLQARIINSKEIVKPGRYLIKEGILNKLSRKEAQERMFFLLTDCLLYCEHAPVSNQYKLREELPLASMTLSVPENIDFNKEFTIISTKRSFTVVASSTEERDEWAIAIQNAIDDVSRKIGTFTIKLDHNEKSSQLSSPAKDIGQIAPMWVPDARATMCSICCRRFTTYNRRHHCRACGEIVCKDCSSFEAPLSYLGFEAARVCEKCFKLLLDTHVEEDIPENKDAETGKTKLRRSKSVVSSRFKIIKKTKRDRPTRKTLPSTLTEVCAQDQECSISGYLFIIKKKKQKKRWFVLKEHALYSYKAPSDPAAHSTLAVLGYSISVTGDFDAGDFLFQLEHSGLKEPYVYKAESRESADMWVNALRKAASLQSS